MRVHKFIFNGTPQEFHTNLRKRGTAQLSNYIDNRGISRARPFLHDGKEYTIESFPTVRMQGEVLYRLEYYASGIPEGMTIEEQRDEGIYGTHEIGIVIELSQRIDGRTDVIATCTHPAYDQEFTAMFGATEVKPTITDKSTLHKKGGRPPLQAHTKAIKRLQQGEKKETNYYKWMREYEEETGTHPDDMASEAAELYRKMVWAKRRKHTG